MLVLSRKRSEQIVINGSIRITVVKLDRGTVRLGVEAPPDVLDRTTGIARRSRRAVGDRGWRDRAPQAPLKRR